MRPAIPNRCPAFHTDQLSDQSSLSGPWLVMAHLFSQLQISSSSPISLAWSQPAPPALGGEYCPSQCMPPAVCLLLPFYLPSDFQVPPGRDRPGYVICDFPALGGEGAATLPAYKITLPSIFKCPLQPLASELHFGWNSVASSLCS